MEQKNIKDIISSDWCYYLVAFLDVLGQKDIFTKLAQIRSIEEIDEEIKRDISENLYYLEQLRKNLEKYFNEYTRGEASPGLVDESHKDKFDQMRKSEIHFQFFSDSIIAFIPLEFKSFYSVTVNGAWGLLGASCAAILGSLALNHSIRGGIEINWGTRLKSGEIYGPALNKAYYLESVVAEYPRVVIGEGVWNYLHSLSNKIQQHVAQTQRDIDLCKRMADRCLNLISEDRDCLPILDYLGKGFLELYKNCQEFFKIYDSSRKYIRDSLIIWQKKKARSIEAKYKYLNDYFENRAVIVERARKTLKVRGR